MIEFDKWAPAGAFNHFLHDRHMQDVADYIMRNPPAKGADWGFPDLDVLPTENLCYLKIDRSRAIFIQGDTAYFCHTFLCKFSITDDFDDYGTYLDIDGRIDFHGKTYDFSLHGIHYYEQNVLSDTHTQNYIPKYPGVRANQLLIPELSGMTDAQKQRRLDTEAMWFLKTYCPAALEMVMPVPIRKIVEDELHLTIITDKKLSDSLEILGEVLFYARRLTVTDENTGEEETLVFPRGSILIDSDVFWERGLGSFNFTLAHEIYHWLRHRVHIQFMQFVEIPEDYAKAKEIMEIQANGFAARVLMPTHSVRKYYTDMLGGNSDAESSEMAVSRTARFFGVSKTSVNFRLNGMGICEYKAPPAIRRRIDAEELLELYLTDGMLCELLETEAYLYIDGYVVKNDPLYIEEVRLGIPPELADSDDELTLTEYALSHIEECTLPFRKVSNRLVSEKVEQVLHKAGSYSLTMDYNIRMQLTKEGKRIEEDHPNLSDRERQAIQEKRQQTERLQTGYQAKFERFWDRAHKWPTFCEYILPIIMKKNEQFMTLDILDDHDDALQEQQGKKRKKVSHIGIKQLDFGYQSRYFWAEDFPTGKRRRIPETEVFQARTLVSYKIFVQIRSNRWEKPSLDMVVAICAGYHLTMPEVEEALKYAGYYLLYNRTHLVYRFLFTVGRDLFHDTDTFNTYLMFLNEKPLGSKANEATERKKTAKKKA